MDSGTTPTLRMAVNRRHPLVPPLPLHLIPPSADNDAVPLGTGDAAIPVLKKWEFLGPKHGWLDWSSDFGRKFIILLALIMCFGILWYVHDTSEYVQDSAVNPLISTLGPREVEEEGMGQIVKAGLSTAESLTGSVELTEGEASVPPTVQLNGEAQCDPVNGNMYFIAHLKHQDALSGKKHFPYMHQLLTERGWQEAYPRWALKSRPRGISDPQRPWLLWYVTEEQFTEEEPEFQECADGALQMVNQIPGQYNLTYKSALGDLGQSIMHGKVDKWKCLPDSVRFPYTYFFIRNEDRQAFFKQIPCSPDPTYKRLWLQKPVHANRGRGVSLVDDMEAFRDLYLTQKSDPCNRVSHGWDAENKPNYNIVVQEYIANPLLLDKRKFDMRTYLYIASSEPLLVYYHTGFIRKAAADYSPDPKFLTNKTIHLTNVAVGMHSGGAAYKSLIRPLPYMEESLGVKGLVNQTEDRMKRLMVASVLEVLPKLRRQNGLFAIIGADFMMDKDENVYMIEFTHDPALYTYRKFKTTEKLLPSFVDIMLEVNKRQRTGNVQGMGTSIPSGSFQLLIDETTNYVYGGCGEIPKSHG